MGEGCVEWTEISPNSGAWNRQDICEVAEATEEGIEYRMFNDAKSSESYPETSKTILMSDTARSAAHSPCAGSRIIMKSSGLSNYDFYGNVIKVAKIFGQDKARSSLEMQTSTIAITAKGAMLSNGNYYVTGAKIIMREVT